MGDVFLSYASEDVDQAQVLATAMEVAGYSVWWDRHLMSGERYHQKIERELASASAVVVLWTPASVASEWVYSEARRGNQRDVLVQVRSRAVGIDDLPAPFDALHCPFAEDEAGLLRAVGALVRPSAVPAEATRSPSTTVGASGERKTVTVLTAELEGASSLDPEDLDALASRHGDLLRAQVERFGGTFGSAQGLSFTAWFGAPRAHEDDPERAVRAGLAVLDAGAERPTTGHTDPDGGLKLGVATGPALVTSAGVSGAVTAEARRLATIAEVGSTLVDAATYSATRHVVDCEAVDGAWRVAGLRGYAGGELPGRSIPMIGREDELVQIERCYLRACRDSSVQLVTIVGDPGLGKSRLVQAFSDWVDRREQLVIWRQGRTPPYGDTVAYAALAQIVKAHAGVLDSDAAHAAQAKLTSVVHAVVVDTDQADQEAWLVARLAPLVGLPAVDAPREELFTAWTRFIEAIAARSPLVLVVEDLHWADPSMLDFLAHLLDTVTGVALVLIATTRPELFESTPDWGAGLGNHTMLRLSPLTPGQTAELVETLLGGAELPDDVRTSLVAKSAGHPLYTREFVTMAAASPGEPASASTLAGRLPDTVQAVIAARLDLLSGPTKRVLQAAAVVGHTFWSGPVAVLTGVSQDEVDLALADLVRREYVRRVRTSRVAGQAEFVFAHALIADVAQAQLPRSERARLHEAVGQWHAGLIAQPDLSGESSVVAHHLAAAHEWARKAGEDDARVSGLAASASTWHVHAAAHDRHSDVAAALTHASLALDLTPGDRPARAERLLLVGELLAVAGRSDEAETNLSQAAEVAEVSGDPVLAAHARLSLAAVLNDVGRLAEARELRDGAVAVLERHPPGVELADGYLLVAEQHIMNAEDKQAIPLIDRALDIIETLPEPRERHFVRAYRGRGAARVWSGDAQGFEDLDRARSLAEEHLMTSELILVNDMLAGAHYVATSISEAQTFERAAVQAAALSGEWGHHLYASSKLAESLVMAGHLDDAIEVCVQATKHPQRSDHSRGWTNLRVTWGRALLVRGDDADQVIAEALADARRSTLDIYVSALLVAVERDRLLGSEDAALTDELTKVADEAGAATVVDCLSRVARIVAAVGRVELLERLIEA